MGLADCAIKSADNAASYYNGLINHEYVVGLVANFALNFFSMLISNRFEREERIMLPALAELVCISLYLCSYNLSSFKAAVFALSKMPSDQFIKGIDQRVDALSRVFIKDYHFQAGLLGIMRVISAGNGLYFFYNKNRLAVMLSLIVFGAALYRASNTVNENFFQEEWRVCKS